jgi:peptidoglycan hydrolase-like protein with peptidoglycan-binding domain
MSQRDSPVDAATYTRRRILVGVAAVGLPALLYAQSRSGSPSTTQAEVPDSVQPDSLLSTLTADSAVATSQAASTIPMSSNATAAWVPFDHAVAVGAGGNEVGLLQDRLRQLGFDPGVTDKSYGPATKRAVWAYEKIVLDVAPTDVTGVVSPDIWARMNEEHEIRPRRSHPGTHLEVLLDRQVAVLYVADAVRLITHISSGSGETWCSVVVVDQEDGSQTEEGICGVAVTPGGVFHFDRRVEGWRNSKLGRLYNPVYFNYGLAVHGASNVPSYPASHGCVRIPMHIAEYFPSLVSNGDVVYVFDGVKQPETYGAQVPTFDYPDPNYIPPSTTTTTTTMVAGSTQTLPESATTTTHPNPVTSTSQQTAPKTHTDTSTTAATSTGSTLANG